ncbi:autorepressor SdpR family transcription factor [Peptococcus simiae]|uniref:autorepressor SdpR family transcription factor n=1 Tax=Peptococcus simiae TaxID=1643805 RepID=UPI00397F3960
MDKTFKALADSQRRDMLKLLRAGPMAAGEIGAHFDLTGATVSYHLSILKAAGLVRTDKEGNRVIYSLNTSVFEDLLVFMASFKEGIHE